jgi:Spy/CpxP family protein refolding chaperone
MSNNTNNRWLSVLTLFLLTANIVTLVLLWTNKKVDREYFMPQPQPGGQVFEFINNELNLDAAQQSTYKTLREEHQAGIRPVHDSMRKAKDRLFDLLQQENVAEATMLEYGKRIGELEQQRDVITFKHFQKLRAICNKEQQKKFDNIIQDVLRRMGGPKRQPGPPPPGMENVDRRPPPRDE